MAIDISSITSGSRVVAIDVAGRRLGRRAVTGIVQGHEFPVIWVCSEAEWQSAQIDGRDPDAVPWPAEDVITDAESEDDPNAVAYRILHDATE
jgi:hypothetical protein